MFREVILNVLNEDAESDYKLIQEADEVYKLVIKYVKQNMNKCINYLNADYTFRISLSIPSLNDVAIDLMDNPDDRNKGKYNQRFNLIQLNLPRIFYGSRYYEDIKMKKITPERLLEMLNWYELKSVFLHEYQHFKYYQNEKTKSLTYNVNGTEDYKKYRRNHNENNSFSLQEFKIFIDSFNKKLNFEIKRDKSLKGNKSKILNILNQWMSNFWSQHAAYLKGTKMYATYYKRLYKLLYWLFIENNIQNTKDINKQIRKDLNKKVPEVKIKNFPPAEYIYTKLLSKYMQNYKIYVTTFNKENAFDISINSVTFTFLVSGGIDEIVIQPDTNRIVINFITPIQKIKPGNYYLHNKFNFSRKEVYSLLTSEYTKNLIISGYNELVNKSS